MTGVAVDWAAFFKRVHTADDWRGAEAVRRDPRLAAFVAAWKHLAPAWAPPRVPRGRLLTDDQLWTLAWSGGRDEPPPGMEGNLGERSLVMRRAVALRLIYPDGSIHERVETFLNLEDQLRSAELGVRVNELTRG